MTKLSGLPLLHAMLTFCRPYGESSDKAFCKRFIAPIPGSFVDAFGNWHVDRRDVRPGPISRTVWSAHTDTVHDDDGRQTIHVDPDGTIGLSKRSKRTSDCLGADDTVGVWILLELLARNIPGYYVFHYGEERGGIGSRALLAKHGAWFGDHFDRVIALDRAGYADVITHQGSRTCSDAFAQALADGLGGKFTPCDRGIYTDSKEYAHDVPECTNLSVGYHHAHTSNETADGPFALSLLERLATLDIEGLPTVRNVATDNDYAWVTTVRAEPTHVSSFRPAIVSGYPAHSTTLAQWLRDSPTTETPDACEHCGRFWRDDALIVCPFCGMDRSEEDSVYLDADIALVQRMLRRQRSH